MPAATRAFANKATEAGKFASWNKPFANYAQEDPPKDGDKKVQETISEKAFNQGIFRTTFYGQRKGEEMMM